MKRFEDSLSHIDENDEWDIESDDSEDWEGVCVEGNAELTHFVNQKSFKDEHTLSIFDQMILHETEEKVITMFKGASTRESVIEHFVHLRMLQDQAKDVSYQSYEHIYLLILEFSIPESIVDRYQIRVWQNMPSEWCISCHHVFLTCCTSENKARNLGFHFCIYAFELMESHRHLEVKLKEDIFDLEQKVERVQLRSKKLPIRGAGSQFSSNSKNLTGN